MTACSGIAAFAGGLTWARRVEGAQATQAANGRTADAIARVKRVASASKVADYAWLKRGKAPAGFIHGMAVSFAKLHHELSVGNPVAVEMARQVGTDPAKDALKHYEDAFREAGMDNGRDGSDTLRHLFVLMLGLGMRESSGRWCEGRDRSANNTTAETAEAGLFQTSYNARRGHELMPKLFAQFREKAVPSYAEVFKEGVRVREGELDNYGEGDGRAFQQLSKECPFFALVFAGVGLRNIRKHWGPINRRDAEIRQEADDMFKAVQQLVDREKLGAWL